MFQGFWSAPKTAGFFFSEHLLLTVFMFMNFYFCWDIDFFLFSSFSIVFSLKRHYIGFFKNIVYLCMQSSSVNMLSANWGETPPILIKMVFSGELPPLRKLKKIPGNQTVEHKMEHNWVQHKWNIKMEHNFSRK